MRLIDRPLVWTQVCTTGFFVLFGRYGRFWRGWCLFCGRFRRCRWYLYRLRGWCLSWRGFTTFNQQLDSVNLIYSLELTLVDGSVLALRDRSGWVLICGRLGSKLETVSEGHHDRKRKETSSQVQSDYGEKSDTKKK